MPNWIEGDLTTLAFLWRIERRDGVALGFTSHDADLVVDGLTYAASPGMLPSAIERSDGLDTDNVELTGALTSDAITADDLAAGRWDGASLRLSAVSWENPTEAPLNLIRGELGSVEIADGRFAVTLRGPTLIFDAPVCEETSPDCRAVLGDKRCRVDLSGRKKLVKLVTAAGAMITVDQAAPDGAYAFGQLRWIDGPNSGLEARILSSSGGQLTLEEPPHFAVTAGTRMELGEGCDKRFETCIQRFSNAENFRGEPHLPGNDLLTRYAS
jgi:uncharacterized phage protein (TIGR02218 family)